MDMQAYRGDSFEQIYRCYPSTLFSKLPAQQEIGDKIIMPVSALNTLVALEIDYPMLFELRNSATERVSYCGVLEFTAEEGMIYMPYWMMQNLLLQEGETVQVKNATLPKGTYVKLQPHNTDFLDISNIKAVLETALRKFSCLTTGDSILVPYNNKQYYIDIVEAKPSNAISIIETDCEVDFAPPLDYKEHVKATSSAPAPAPAPSEQTPAQENLKLNTFIGVGRRLDGKSVASPVSTSNDKNKRPEEAKDLGNLPALTGSGQRPGKLVFGSNVDQTPKVVQKTTAKETNRQVQPQEEEEPKFKPFTGKKYSLRD